MNSQFATIVVFEKQPRWAPELERQFQGDDVHIRGIAALRDELSERPGPLMSLLVVVLEDAEARCLQFLGRLARAVDPPRAVVVANSATAEMEWTIRELGAASVVSDRVTGEEMSYLCRRILSS